MMDAHDGHRQRLRERFLKTGLNGFAEYEIVELLLTLCIPRMDVKPFAKELIRKFGSVKNIIEQNPERLLEIKGLGNHSITCIKIIKALSDYYLFQKSSEMPILRDNATLVNFWRAKIGFLQTEVFEVAFLNGAYQLLPNGVERIEEGITHQTHIYPQKILKSAIAHNAVNLVISHNHPSGNPRPSPNDITLTHAIKTACSILGIRLVDHVIITHDSYYSFRESGLLA